MLGLPCADYDFATWEGNEGVLSPIFVPKPGRLIHGNELLGKFIEKYPKTNTYRVREYKISTVIALIQTMSTIFKLPIGYRRNFYITDILDVFVGYLMFDCLIANTDRHHENWGFIANLLDKTIHLAPTYDHASSLGCRLNDEEIYRRINTNDKRYTVEAFVNRGKSAFYGKDLKQLPFHMPFLVASKQKPKAAIYWLSKVEKLSLRRIVFIFGEIPEHLISKQSVNFAVEIINANRNKLLSFREDIEKWIQN